MVPAVVNCTVMLAVPTIVGSVVSRKCVGSLLVIVIISLDGGATGIDTLPLTIMLLPAIGPLTLIAGAAVTEIGTVTVLMPGELIVNVGLPTATPVTVI